MEDISCLSQKKKYPLEIDIHAYFYDHHLEGKAILPAVEALIILARTVQLNFSEQNITCMDNAQFPRFLSIPAGEEKIAVFVDMEKTGPGLISAALISSVKSKAGNISRKVEHARVAFKAVINDKISAHPFRVVEKLEGRCVNIPAVSIYHELVPFGAAYHNITDLSLSPEGALAYVSGGNQDADDSFIGSPFPLDAAMHAACVWAQRYTGIVPFPVGFKERIICQMTKKGGTYLSRIRPVKYDEQPFVFDIWIFDVRGEVCETVWGLQMRDVSQGRMRPPAWIKDI